MYSRVKKGLAGTPFVIQPRSNPPLDLLEVQHFPPSHQHIQKHPARRIVTLPKKLKSLGKSFDRREKVFSVNIFGTSEVNDYKFENAVNILCDYLSNDSDGNLTQRSLSRALN